MPYDQMKIGGDAYPVQSYERRFNARRGFYRLFGKRIFDVSASLILLAAAAPILITVTLMLLVTGGSPLFGHLRIGQDHSPFKCWKFRTMRKGSSRDLRFMLRTDVHAAREWQDAQKLTFDPRVTRIGKFLRATSLDELPQLFNVLSGHMSMVGPRPVTKKELERYGASLPIYLAARPGLTGYWQVHGRGTTEFSQRVAMDVRYVRNINFLTDLKLVIQTVSVVLKRTGT